jgi:Protein ENHANCED DISEASE RESISTANCE 2, C-terminal
MASLTVDIGFVIQAEEAHELPEQMMGATRVHGVDPIKAPQL